MTQATPNPSRDTRPTVAAHPLPWKIVPGRDAWDKSDFDIVDASDDLVWSFDEDELAGFWRGLVADVNRLGRMNLARSMVCDDVDKMLADIASGKKTRDQVIEENHAAWLRDTGGFILSTPAIPAPPPEPSIDDHPEGAAVFRFNAGLTKQMTREEMHDHMQRVILVDLASQQRILALESALIEVAELSCPYVDDFGEGMRPLVQAILDRLGLAHRLDGNQSKAEQVTA